MRSQAAQVTTALVIWSVFYWDRVRWRPLVIAMSLALSLLAIYRMAMVPVVYGMKKFDMILERLWRTNNWAWGPPRPIDDVEEPEEEEERGVEE